MLSLIRYVKTPLEPALSFPSFRAVGLVTFCPLVVRSLRRWSMRIFKQARRPLKTTAVSPEDLPIGSSSPAACFERLGCCLELSLHELGLTPSRRGVSPPPETPCQSETGGKRCDQLTAPQLKKIPVSDD